jgi:hypothetical protein
MLQPLHQLHHIPLRKRLITLSAIDFFSRQEKLGDRLAVLQQSVGNLIFNLSAICRLRPSRPFTPARSQQVTFPERAELCSTRRPRGRCIGFISSLLFSTISRFCSPAAFTFDNPSTTSFTFVVNPIMLILAVSPSRFYTVDAGPLIE